MTARAAVAMVVLLLSGAAVSPAPTVLNTVMLTSATTPVSGHGGAPTSYVDACALYWLCSVWYQDAY